jgi:hypothetical protein
VILEEVDRVFIVEKKGDYQKELGDQQTTEFIISMDLEDGKSYPISPQIQKLAGTDCDLQFSEAFNLDFRKGGSDEHHCSLCPKHFSRPYNLIRHIISVHEKFREDVSEIYCKYCKAFLDRSRYINHLVLKKFTCGRCQKFFTIKGHWTRHEAKCGVSNRPQSCEVCGKVLPNEYKMNAHIRTHHSELFKSCKFCQESLRTPEKLEKHLREVHRNGEVPKRKCGYCSEEFQLALEFHQHIAGHLDGNICRTCGENFQGPRELSAHQSGHWKGRIREEYTCDLCGTRKKSKGLLVDHLLEDHLEVLEDDEEQVLTCQSFPCQWDGCAQRFDSYQELNCHISEEHDTGDFIEEYLII